MFEFMHHRGAELLSGIIGVIAWLALGIEWGLGRGINVGYLGTALIMTTLLGTIIKWRSAPEGSHLKSNPSIMILVLILLYFPILPLVAFMLNMFVIKI